MTIILRFLLKTSLGVFLLLPINAFAQISNSAFDQLHNDILNLKTKNTQQRLMAISISSPLGNQLTCYSDFIDFMTSTEIFNQESTIKKFDQQLEFLYSQNESPEQLIAICDILLFKSTIAFLNREYLWSTTEYLKAKKNMKKISGNYPDHYINYKYDLLESFADILLSENMPFNKSSNTEQLKAKYTEIIQKATSDKNVPENTKKEIRILAILLCSHIDNGNICCFNIANLFHPQWKESGPIEALSFAEASIRASKHSAAHETLLYAINAGYNNRLNKINLTLGSSYLNQQNDSALIFLNTFIERQENEKDVTYAKLKLSWYYYINGKYDKTNELVSEISSSNRESTPEERQAKYEIRNHSNWSKPLLRARLLFDGGDYGECIKLLHSLNISELNKEQVLEYNYRMGRAYHLSNNPYRAIMFYQKVINSNMDNTFYYPAYSAYYSGLLYKYLADNENAKKYFKKCTNLKSPVYEWSIHKKAKHELDEID